VLTLLANWSVGTCYLSVVGGATNVATSQPGPASAGWIGLHTFAVSFVPTGGGHMTTTWWVDGAPAFTGTTSLTSVITIATEFRVLCARFAGGGLTSHVGDRLGEARLYNRILTDTQVAAIDASMRAT
jgi:hypothetical protein